MASETMTVQEAIELCEPNDARASAEQWLTAMAVLVAHARATTAGTGAGGGRVTEAMVEAGARAEYARVFAEATPITYDGLDPSFRDSMLATSRCVLTAALAASARGA